MQITVLHHIHDSIDIIMPILCGRSTDYYTNGSIYSAVLMPRILMKAENEAFNLRNTIGNAII